MNFLFVSVLLCWLLDNAMLYKRLERRFLVSLRCLGVMRAAQPSQVIKDNQWKMRGSVVLCIPNPTYNRNSARNDYLNLTPFFFSFFSPPRGAVGDGTRNCFSAGAPKKARNSKKITFRRIDTDRNTLETLNWLLCFPASDRFLSAMFTFRYIKWQRQTCFISWSGINLPQNIYRNK